MILFRNRIHEHAKNSSGENPGKTKFIAKYSDAVKEIIKKLSPQEQKQAADLANDWNENGLPKDMQLE
jgi:hypothetical protein